MLVDHRKEGFHFASSGDTLIRVMRLLFVAAAVFSTVLVLPSISTAVIVPQKSIAGAAIGMTEKQVRAELGAPSRVRKGSNDFGPWRQLVYHRVLVTFQGWNTVSSLRTTLYAQRTSAGLGVSSTLAAVRAKLKGEICRYEFGTHHCWIGRWEAGRIVTDFTFKRNRVNSIVVARVID